MTCSRRWWSWRGGEKPLALGNWHLAKTLSGVNRRRRPNRLPFHLRWLAVLAGGVLRREDDGLARVVHLAGDEEDGGGPGGEQVSARQGFD